MTDRAVPVELRGFLAVICANPHQPTLWGHAARVPGRGWRGAPPPRPPTGPRSRRKSTGCRTAPASTRQLGIDAACDRHHVPQPGGMVRPHRAESGAGGGAASLRARRRRVRSWGPAARASGGSKGAEPPLASPECCTLGKLALPCELVKTGPVPLALPRPFVAACHPALCSAPIVGEGSRRWGHFRGSSATAARCSTGRRDDVSASGPVSATRRIRVNGHRKLHRSGHRKLHTWRR